jgi:peptide/nickel transport system substrate-binding protein
MPSPIAAQAQPTAEPDPATQRIVFAHPEDAAKLDPADVTDSESLLVTWHLYEGLTRYKPGTAEIEPALAESWTVSDDGLEWTFKLREGVTFHDGTPFDAEAVVWNFNRWFDPEHPQHFEGWDFTYWPYMFQGYKGEDKNEDDVPDSVLASAEAVDASTVKLVLNRPNAPLLQTLAMGNFGFSSPAAVETAADSYGTPDGDPIAAGTGPYKVKEWVPVDHITVERNDDYWGEAPPMREIEFRVIPDGTARFLSLAAGEIDGMTQVNPEDIAKAEADENIQVVFEPANNVGYLGINQARPPWDNLNCRLALAHAIDKQAIADTLYAGDAVPATQMMPPDLWGYNKSLVDYPYDPVKAKEYLDLCIAEVGELPAEVTFYVPPIQRFYFPKPKELGETIQAGLNELGIVTTISSPEWGAVYLPEVREGKADLFLLGWGGDNGDPDNFLCQFFCGGDASFNSAEDGTAMPPDEELDVLLREAATLTDQAERRVKYEEANARILETVPAVPLVHRTPPILLRSNLSGYTASPLQQILTGVTKE